MLGKYANGSSEAMEKADNRRVNFSWIIVSIVWIWMGWQTFINDECLSSLDQHHHSGELLQVILDASDSRHASVNVIRFTQHWITQCRENFPNTKSNYLIFLVPWALVTDHRQLIKLHSGSLDLLVLEKSLNHWIFKEVKILRESPRIIRIT